MRMVGQIDRTNPLPNVGSERRNWVGRGCWLFVAEALYGIEAGGTGGGDCSEQDAD
jgi:hypothetical protein